MRKALTLLAGLLGFTAASQPPGARLAKPRAHDFTLRPVFQTSRPRGRRSCYWPLECANPRGKARIARRAQTLPTAP